MTDDASTTPTPNRWSLKSLQYGITIVYARILDLVHIVRGIVATAEAIGLGTSPAIRHLREFVTVAEVALRTAGFAPTSQTPPSDLPPK